MNPTVGALDENAQRVLEMATKAARAGAELAVTPELALVGYPPRDLLDRLAFVHAARRTTERVIEQSPEGIVLIFGTLGGTDGPPGRRLYNEAVAVSGGRVLARCRKKLLPNYDVFDEARYFEPGDSPARLDVDGHRVAITICEDAWAETDFPRARYASNPLEGIGAENTDMLVNLSASPFTLPKLTERARVFGQVAKTHEVVTVLTNQVGGNDELIFDGRSTVWDAKGNVIGRAPAFEEALLLVDTEAPSPIADEPDSDEAAAYGALLTGVRDYTKKCGFSRVVIGLSGGIDSALVATIAADALGAANVIGMALPTRHSSEGSLTDARALADNLGLEFHVVDIDPVFQAYIDGLGKTLDEVRAPPESDVTLENVQARIRGATVMAMSNRTGALVLTTGNKSEIAVGYCTLYGDMVGGLSVISDIPKTMVWRIARWVNRHGERIPKNSIEKPPSAELRPDQRDSDSLPDYELLDPVLEGHVERGLGRDELVAEGHDPAMVDKVIRLVQFSEYKRRQAAPGIIVTRKAFGMGRRMPIAQKFREWK